MTGDPSCPEVVRRAKTIQRSIRNRIVSINIGDNSEEDCVQNIHSQLKKKRYAKGEEPNEDFKAQHKMQKTSKLDFVPLTRPMQLDLLEHIECMSSSVCKLADNIEGNKEQNKVSKEDIRTIIRKEVAATIKEIFEPQDREKHFARGSNNV